MFSKCRFTFNCIFSGVFINALRSLLSEQHFKLASPPAIAAVSTASALLSWCENEQNTAIVATFAIWLNTRLRSCLHCRQHSIFLPHTREAMWSDYHKLRTSPTFADGWRDLFKRSLQLPSDVHIVQYVTHTIFKGVVRDTYPVSVPEHSSTTSMTTEEEYALRYVAGFVCKNLRLRLERPSTTVPSINKDTAILLLSELSLGDEQENATAAWLNSVDRGGLLHVNDSAYRVFASFEHVIRTHLTFKTADKQHKASREEIVKSVLESKDVQRNWNDALPVDDAMSSWLLKELVESYTTIRGYAFASSCMEIYKQSQKRTIQKQKPLRKKISSSD